MRAAIISVVAILACGCGGRTSIAVTELDGGTRTSLIPCASSPGASLVGRRCDRPGQCAGLPSGRCAVLRLSSESEIGFCTMDCSSDADCGAGARCQSVWCGGGRICMPTGCCQGPADCDADEVCQVNRPGGLCADGPCCSEPTGAFACRQRCTQGSTDECPPQQPNCERISVGTEDYVESFDVCMP
jgi:hypothetical protein